MAGTLTAVLLEDPGIYFRPGIHLGPGI